MKLKKGGLTCQYGVDKDLTNLSAWLKWLPQSRAIRSFSTLPIKGLTPCQRRYRLLSMVHKGCTHFSIGFNCPYGSQGFHLLVSGIPGGIEGEGSLPGVNVHHGLLRSTVQTVTQELSH